MASWPLALRLAHDTQGSQLLIAMLLLLACIPGSLELPFEVPIH